MVAQVSLAQPTPGRILPQCFGKVELAGDDCGVREYDVDRVEQCQFKVSGYELRFQLEPVLLTHVFDSIQ